MLEHLESTVPVNPYSPPGTNSLPPEVAEQPKPVIGPIIVSVTAAVLACFLGYLFAYSPPDRWPATVLSALVPGIVGYAWILRFRFRYAMPAMAILGVLVLAVLLYLGSHRSASRMAILLLFASISIPILLGGAWTRVTFRRYIDND